MPIGDWPPDPTQNPAWLQGILQVMNLKNPDYARLNPSNLLTAASHQATAGNYPVTPGVGASSQSGGTGPTVTAAPTATGASAAQPAKPAQPAGAPATSPETSESGQSGSPAVSSPAPPMASPTPAAMPSKTSDTPPVPPLGASPLDSSPVSQAARAAVADTTSTPAAQPGPAAQPAPAVSSLPQTIAAGQASGVPTAPLTSLWDNVYGNAGEGERGGGGPALNPQTFRDFWNTMLQSGDYGSGSGVSGGTSKGDLTVGRGGGSDVTPS